MIDGRRLLGVLDCAEPLAGAAFLERLTAAARRRGGAAVPVVLWSDAEAAGSCTGSRSGSAAPAAVLLGLHVLERAGADAVVIPGTTAQAWYRDLSAAAHVPIMHMVECAAADVRRVGPAGAHIAVVAEAAGKEEVLYQAKLRGLGFRVLPTPATAETSAAEAIEHHRRGDSGASERALAACVGELGRAGAAAVVLASDTLSHAAHRAGIRHLGRAGAGGPAVIDSLESLAGAAVAWGHGACDAWDLVADVPEEVPEPAAAPPS